MTTIGQPAEYYFGQTALLDDLIEEIDLMSGNIRRHVLPLLRIRRAVSNHKALQTIDDDYKYMCEQWGR